MHFRSSLPATFPLLVLLLCIRTADGCSIFSCPSSSCFWAGLGNAWCYDKEPGGERCKSNINGNQYNHWCWSNVCRTEKCCDPGASSGCSACNSAGTCTSCYSGYYHQSSNCHAKKSDGSTCSSGVQCSNGICRTRCCKSGISSQCTSCSSSGNCASCSSSLKYPSGTTCLSKKNPGLTCGGSIQCLSGSCKGGRCCQSGINALCTSCDATGNCASCSSGYYPSGLSCLSKKSNGDTCTANIQCSNNICKGSNCCKAGNPSTCTGCNGAGNCDQCTSTHYLSGTSCLLAKTDGQTCSFDGQCVNGHCHTRCCKSGSSTGCTVCGGSGTCTSCSSTHYLSSGNCLTKIADGGSCGADGQCVNGHCHTRCCRPGRASQCTSCDASGDCVSCSSTHYVDSGNCVVKHVDGSSCSAGMQCSNSICKGSNCCKPGNPSTCTGCNGAGDCDQCTSTHYLLGTSCLLKKNPGESCSANNWCSLSDCRGGKCCSTGHLASCTSCGSSGECNGCDAGKFLHLGQCCLNGVSSKCTTCNHLGWCTACSHGWFLRGINCISSITETFTPTTTVLPTMSTTVIQTATESITASKSPLPTLSPSLTATVMASDTITTMPSATPSVSEAISASISQPETISSSIPGTGTLLVTASRTFTKSVPEPPTPSMTTSATVLASSSATRTSTQPVPPTPSRTSSATLMLSATATSLATLSLVATGTSTASASILETASPSIPTTSSESASGSVSSSASVSVTPELPRMYARSANISRAFRGVPALYLDPLSRYFATGIHTDGSVIVWDQHTALPLATLLPGEGIHNGTLAAFAMVAFGERIVLLFEDGFVSVVAILMDAVAVVHHRIEVWDDRIITIHGSEHSPHVLLQTASGSQVLLDATDTAGLTTTVFNATVNGRRQAGPAAPLEVSMCDPQATMLSWLPRSTSISMTSIPALNESTITVGASILGVRCVHQGQTVAVILTDGRVLLFDAATRAVIHEAHTVTPVVSFAIAEEGAVATSDGQRIAIVRLGAVSVASHSSPVLHLAFQFANGSHLAISGPEHSKIINCATRVITQTHRAVHRSAPLEMRIAHDGQSIDTVSSNEVLSLGADLNVRGSLNAERHSQLTTIQLALAPLPQLDAVPADDVQLSLKWSAPVAMRLSTADSSCSVDPPLISCSFGRFAERHAPRIVVLTVTDTPSFYAGAFQLDATLNNSNTNAVLHRQFSCELATGDVVDTSRSGLGRDPLSFLSPAPAVHRSPDLPTLPPAAQLTIRGVFSPSADSSTGIHFVVWTALVYAIWTTTGHIITRLLLKKNSGSVMISEEDPRWKFVLRHHMWASLLYPCHARCHGVHTMGAYVSVLSGYAICVGAMFFAGDVWTSWTQVFFLATVTALGMPIARALLAYPFNSFTQNSATPLGVRNKRRGLSFAYQPVEEKTINAKLRNTLNDLDIGSFAAEECESVSFEFEEDVVVVGEAYRTTKESMVPACNHEVDTTVLTSFANIDAIEDFDQFESYDDDEGEATLSLQGDEEERTGEIAQRDESLNDATPATEANWPSVDPLGLPTLEGDDCDKGIDEDEAVATARAQDVTSAFCQLGKQGDAVVQSAFDEFDDIDLDEPAEDYPAAEVHWQDKHSDCAPEVDSALLFGNNQQPPLQEYDLSELKHLERKSFDTHPGAPTAALTEQTGAAQSFGGDSTTASTDHDAPTIRVMKHRLSGYVAGAIFAAAISILLVYWTSAWTPRHYATFWMAISCGFVANAAVVEFLVLGVSLLFRWLSDSNEDDDSKINLDAMLKQWHPYDGEQRHFDAPGNSLSNYVRGGHP